MDAAADAVTAQHRLRKPIVRILPHRQFHGCLDRSFLLLSIFRRSVVVASGN